MQIRSITRYTLFLLICSSPFCSSQFKQPTGEELKMTTDPKAPGAAAVYLDIEENSDDLVYMQSYYVRAKVLWRKARSWPPSVSLISPRRAAR